MYRDWYLFGVGVLRGEVRMCLIVCLKFWIEVLVNGGCNYNGFKVVKFFVG